MNIRSAQEMMKTQTLEYVFPFSGYKFETDVCFLITTEGKKSTFFEVRLLLCAEYKRANNVMVDQRYCSSPTTYFSQYKAKPWKGRRGDSHSAYRWTPKVSTADWWLEDWRSYYWSRSGQGMAINEVQKYILIDLHSTSRMILFWNALISEMKA